jgi:transcriptional antiterminator RfaH
MNVAGSGLLFKPESAKRAMPGNSLNDRHLKHICPGCSSDAVMPVRSPGRSDHFFLVICFCTLPPHEQRWTSINSTYGAIGAACFGNYYPPVPDAVIQALQARHDDSGLIALPSSEPEAPFKHGEKVRVIHGPMGDIEAIFQCMKGRDRVLVLMNLLGCQSKVELPVDLVAQTG